MPILQKKHRWGHIVEAGHLGGAGRCWAVGCQNLVRDAFIAFRLLLICQVPLHREPARMMESKVTVVQYLTVQLISVVHVWIHLLGMCCFFLPLLIR